MNQALKRLLVSALACLAAYPATAAALLDAPQLGALLKRTPDLVIVDARGEEARKRRQIPFAMTYQPGLIVKTGVAVVVGEQDHQALETARRLEVRKGVTAFAARGGYDAWLAANNGQGGRESVTPQNFTIPHNTCEQGRSLQEYK